MIAALLGFLFIFVLLAAAIALKGWVLTYLWTWFAVPIFHVQPLNYLQAAGLAILATFLIGVTAPKPDTSREGVVHSFSQTFIGPLVVLLVGYLVHLCM